MAGTAAARARVNAARLSFATATPADDPDIIALLEETTFPGDVKVSMERRPSPLAAGVIEGEHELIVARHGAQGPLAGFAARSTRDLHVNGRVARVGYLGQLRIARSTRQLRTLMDEGFAFCRKLHDRRGDTSCYLTSIVADNDAARRLLVNRRSSEAPRFVALATLRTFAIPVRRPRPVDPVAGIRLETGCAALLGEIAGCLDRNLSRYQFAPRWTPDDLRSARTRALEPEDFLVALRGDRVVGCVARWDQQSFRQVVVRGYSPRLARWRPIVNLAARCVDVPSLPPIGDTLRFAFLSHIAVDDDRTDIMAALVSGQCRRAKAAGLSYVVTAFVERHPFHDAIARGFRYRQYDSALYLTFWPDGEPFVRELDDRIPQPEVAVL